MNLKNGSRFVIVIIVVVINGLGIKEPPHLTRRGQKQSLVTWQYYPPRKGIISAQTQFSTLQ